VRNKNILFRIYNNNPAKGRVAIQARVLRQPDLPEELEFEEDVFKDPTFDDLVSEETKETQPP
jgi:hypothetical protein